MPLVPWLAAAARVALGAAVTIGAGGRYRACQSCLAAAAAAAVEAKESD